MLKLARKQKESIIIDDNIKITMLNDPQGQVKLGIEAPDNVEIWREEIYEDVQEEKNG
jgi:carbon storage regulator